ncbi:MAG: YabP/YqfC family sporulation protein [Clostridia bacterium]
MQGKKDGLLVRAADMFDLPADALAGLSHVEIIGARDVLIENHRGILEYDVNDVRVSTGIGIIHICGQCLMISAMNASELKLSGDIQSIEFLTL